MLYSNGLSAQPQLPSHVSKDQISHRLRSYLRRSAGTTWNSQCFECIGATLELSARLSYSEEDRAAAKMLQAGSSTERNSAQSTPFESKMWFFVTTRWRKEIKTCAMITMQETFQILKLLGGHRFTFLLVPCSFHTWGISWSFKATWSTLLLKWNSRCITPKAQEGSFVGASVALSTYTRDCQRKDAVTWSKLGTARARPSIPMELSYVSRWASSTIVCMSFLSFKTFPILFLWKKQDGRAKTWKRATSTPNPASTYFLIASCKLANRHFSSVAPSVIFFRKTRQLG